MAEKVYYDLFLSPSANGEAMMCPLAERLRKDGLKAWFDEWVLKSGDQIPSLRSSRRESAQTSARPDQSVSGLTSAATREEKIEEGLEHFEFGFRISVFGLAKPSMSGNAFGSDWAQLEAGTRGRGNLSFRDPLNQEGRFIPRRLDDASLCRRRFFEVRDPRDAKDEIIAAFCGENA